MPEIKMKYKKYFFGDQLHAGVSKTTFCLSRIKIDPVRAATPQRLLSVNLWVRHSFDYTGYFVFFFIIYSSAYLVYSFFFLHICKMYLFFRFPITLLFILTSCLSTFSFRAIHENSLRFAVCVNESVCSPSLLSFIIRSWNCYCCCCCYFFFPLYISVRLYFCFPFFSRLLFRSINGKTIHKHIYTHTHTHAYSLIEMKVELLCCYKYENY